MKPQIARFPALIQAKNLKIEKYPLHKLLVEAFTESNYSVCSAEHQKNFHSMSIIAFSTSYTQSPQMIDSSTWGYGWPYATISFQYDWKIQTSHPLYHLTLFILKPQKDPNISEQVQFSTKAQRWF